MTHGATEIQINKAPAATERQQITSQEGNAYRPLAAEKKFGLLIVTDLRITDGWILIELRKESDCYELLIDLWSYEFTKYE